VIGRRPTEVGPGSPAIDLFEPAADVVDEHLVAAGPEGECVRVAAPERPYRAILPGRPTVEGVVLRDTPIGVDAEDLAEQRVEFLGGGLGCLLTDGDVQAAVGAEVQCASLMSARDLASQVSLIVPFQENLFAAWACDITIGDNSADDMMRVWLRGHIADVDVRRLGEVRIDSHADQAALPVGGHGE